MKKELTAAEYITQVETVFRKHSNKKRAEGAEAYMRNQFTFFGISTPERRAIQKTFHEHYALPPIDQLEFIVHSLWNKKERELHYFAMEFALKYKKQLNEQHLPLMEFLITTNSWWDSVDVVAPKLVASIFSTRPALAREKACAWIKSDNIWLMRSALLFQLLYKEKTNEKLLFELILKSHKHPDFFIRKAIGWTLRQYARTNTVAVKRFLKENGNQLSPLSLREASKHL